VDYIAVGYDGLSSIIERRTYRITISVHEIGSAEIQECINALFNQPFGEARHAG